MTVCTGRGDRDGGHCCWVGGEVCELLFIDRGGNPRCSVWGKWDEEPYLSSPVARSYEKTWPGKGYHCGDWPQNIPEVMGTSVGACCWQEAKNG